MLHASAPPRILITGGAGFVGSNIAIHLKNTRRDAHILALDNLKRRGSELNLARLRAAGVEFVHGDVRERGDLEALPRITALVDCSAEPSVLAAHHGASDYVVDTNLLGTVNCLRLAARDGADVLFLSTSRVYPIAPMNEACVESGDRFVVCGAPQVPGIGASGVEETFPLDGVRSLYGATKLASELLVQEYAAMHGLRTVVDRCGVIAGPWQMGRTDQGFVMLWLAHHLWGQPLSYIGFGGQGKQVRDVLHVADLCELVERQLAEMDSLAGCTFNVGGGTRNSASLQEFTALSRRITGNIAPISSSSEERPGDLKLYISDNGRIQRMMGWTPARDLDRILSDSLAWLKAHEGDLRGIMGVAVP